MAAKVVVFGSSKTPVGSPEYVLARKVGQNIGRRKLVLVCGGYGGSMSAASQGAHEEGGTVLGITTPIFGDRVPNPYLTERVDEPTYQSRMARLLSEGDAFVALPGGLGTLSELLTAWCLASIGQLGGPLWAFADPWRPQLEALARLPEVRAGDGLVRWVEDAGGLAALMDRWLDGQRSP